MSYSLETLPYIGEGEAGSNPSFEGEFVIEDGNVVFLGMRTDCNENSIHITFRPKDEDKGIDPHYTWIGKSVGKRAVMRVSPKMRSVMLKFQIEDESISRKESEKVVVLER